LGDEIAGGITSRGPVAGLIGVVVHDQTLSMWPPFVGLLGVTPHANHGSRDEALACLGIKSRDNGKSSAVSDARGAAAGNAFRAEYGRDVLLRVFVLEGCLLRSATGQFDEMTGEAGMPRRPVVSLAPQMLERLRITLTSRHELVAGHPLRSLTALLPGLSRARCTTGRTATGAAPHTLAGLRGLNGLVQPLCLLTCNEPLPLSVRLLPDLLAHLLSLLLVLLALRSLSVRGQGKTEGCSAQSCDFEHSHRMSTPQWVSLPNLAVQFAKPLLGSPGLANKPR